MKESELNTPSRKSEEIVIFTPTQGRSQFQIVMDHNAETIWATKLQISEIFGGDRTVINRNLKKCYLEGKLDNQLP